MAIQDGGHYRLDEPAAGSDLLSQEGEPDTLEKTWPQTYQRALRHRPSSGLLCGSLDICWAGLIAEFMVGANRSLRFLTLLVIGTVLEDRTLRAELPGYAEYAQRFRFRLIPGVW